jgi:hypothetical protein
MRVYVLKGEMFLNTAALHYNWNIYGTDRFIRELESIFGDVVGFHTRVLNFNYEKNEMKFEIELESFIQYTFVRNFILDESFDVDLFQPALYVQWPEVHILKATEVENTVRVELRHHLDLGMMSFLSIFCF